LRMIPSTRRASNMVEWSVEGNEKNVDKCEATDICGVVLTLGCVLCVGAPYHQRRGGGSFARVIDAGAK
jgi:hypothetical protein